ncbi:MAG TPA: CCGSCS motif protein [Halomonas sp.]|nr:CCGSCS motif protein [Halomonas sp.]
MGLLKNLFKKDGAEKPQVQMQEAEPVTQADAEAATEAAKEKPKHGEDGVCCGSCQ